MSALLSDRIVDNLTLSERQDILAMIARRFEMTKVCFSFRLQFLHIKDSSYNRNKSFGPQIIMIYAILNLYIIDLIIFFVW
jgi:hypothetical protein